MELIKRIVRVIRANLNSSISSGEDPEKILEQTVIEMQENLVRLRQGVAQAIATQKRTERQAAAAGSQMEEWYRRAQLALQQGNEPLARVALTKRQAYKETTKALSNQIEQQNDIVARLKKDMRSLELKIAEAKTKKDMYIARARSAEASYRLQEMLGGVSATSSLNAFERMEEKVLQIEAKSEAMSGDKPLRVYAQLSSDDLETQFTSLESTNNVDAELAAMKVQVLNEAENTEPNTRLMEDTQNTGQPPQQQLPKTHDS
jgi:phage shock protein A